METEYKITLRILGDQLIPASISQRLSCLPTKAWAIGEVIQQGNFCRRARTGSWSLSDYSVGTLNQRIVQLLRCCQTNLEEWRRITSEFTGEILIGVFENGPQNGFVLNNITLMEIAQRGLCLSIDAYSIYEPTEPIEQK
jgi:hypothetical protein